MGACHGSESTKAHDINATSNNPSSSPGESQQTAARPRGEVVNNHRKADIMEQQAEEAAMPKEPMQRQSPPEGNGQDTSESQKHKADEDKRKENQQLMETGDSQSINDQATTKGRKQGSGNSEEKKEQQEGDRKNSENEECDHGHDGGSGGGPNGFNNNNNSRMEDQVQEEQHDYLELVSDAIGQLRVYDSPLSNQDKVLVMQGWNKVLAFTTAFSEALVLKWRFLVAHYEMETSSWKAVGTVERNQDPIALAMTKRIGDVEELIMGLLDGAFRSLCPHTQEVQRESYRPIEENVIIGRKKKQSMALECETVEDYVRLFARSGIVPQHWVLFCEAFVWCMKTHVPYAQDDDMDDLERGLDSAYARAVAQVVAVRAIEGYASLKQQLHDEAFQFVVPRFWNRHKEAHLSIGETFYRELLTNYPVLLDYFRRTDMDALAIHLVATLDLLVHSVRELGSASNHFKRALDFLGQLHKSFGIPTFTFPLVGAQLLDCLDPLFKAEEELTKNDPVPVTAKKLKNGFAFLYGEVMSIVYYPMLRQEKMIANARQFYEQVKAELGWSEKQMSKRMLEIEKEIAETETYTQTSAELELGCRLAWRNSAKCIGRISWNTLMVRDRRHVSEPAEIFKECEEHLKIATAGTNIQSVMTVFKPAPLDEPLGTRFWSSQFVRYAAYNDEDGKIMGDPANLELTEFLRSKKLWTPPNPKTPFDVLPLVLKITGQKKLFIHQLPRDVIFEVPIEHPTKPEISALAYRWTTVPAITNFKINVGGVVYQNMPFNGWFVSTEIVRNLMERYNVGPECANALDIDINTDPMWKEAMFCELERAVLHSFKKNGFTIVDPTTVGKSFCTHVRREREQFGRECPGQWSWIGGLVGSTNPTWHLEMRDFLLKPQYDYCVEGCVFYKSVEEVLNDSTDETCSIVSNADSIHSQRTNLNGGASTHRPRVLIAYGSETGNSEATARRLKRVLHVLKPTLQSLNEVAENDTIVKRHISHVICVCSTFGKGGPPGNAEEFFSLKLSAHAFQNAKFCVLALGSTLYPDFCAAGVKLDAMLKDAGAERILPLNKVDEAAGADGPISEWIALAKRLVLPPHLEQVMESESLLSKEPAVNFIKWIDSSQDEKAQSGWRQSETSLCFSNTELLPNQGKDSKSIRKITFELPNDVTYESGDHLCVHPLNDDKMVKRFLDCFKTELVTTAKRSEHFPHARDCSDDVAVQWQSQQVFSLATIDDGEEIPTDVFFKTPVQLYDLVQRQLDLALSAKNTVDLLSTLNNCLKEFYKKLDKDSDELEIVSKNALVTSFLDISDPIFEGSSDTKTSAIDSLIAQFPTSVALLENYRELFLEDFTQKELGWKERGPLLNLADILSVLPRLQPRYYSITSSNITCPKEVTITVGVLTTSTSKNVLIEGVCSHYLAGLAGGIDRAKISVSKSSFRLPNNPKAPVLMVGTGTGLSPLMGFLEDKALQYKNNSDIGKIHLFFGCRTENDFLYRDTIMKYESSGMIHLHLALSRSPDVPKKYVQKCIAESGQQVCDMLQNEEAHYYVCGDANMANACFEACVEVLRKHAEISRVKAVGHLRQMQLEGRWQTDVWGIVSHFESSKKAIEKNKKMSAKVWLARFADSEDE